MTHDFQLTIFMLQDNIRQWHAIEGIVLDHAVDGHILKDQCIANLRHRIKAVVANHITSQTGSGAEPAGILFLPRLSGPLQGRTIWHFQHIGHVTGCRCIKNQDGHRVINDIEHLRIKISGIQGNRLARFEINL